MDLKISRFSVIAGQSDEHKCKRKPASNVGVRYSEPFVNIAHDGFVVLSYQ